LKKIRTGRQMSVQNPVFFLARERNLAEEAWPGDMIAISNHASLRIGGTLTEGKELRGALRLRAISGQVALAEGIRLQRDVNSAAKESRPLQQS
jgi:hypothetical protein